MESPYRRIVFLAIEPRLERELVASVLTTDPDTLISRFEPDGTEAKLWIALHAYYQQTDSDAVSCYVALSNSPEHADIATRLLAEFPSLCILFFNRQEQTVHKHSLCLFQTTQPLNFDGLTELWENGSTACSNNAKTL